MLTSCIGAICDEFDENTIYDETNWNTKSSLERNAYLYAKTQQEKLAWDYLRDNKGDFNIVSLLPGKHMMKSS